MVKIGNKKVGDGEPCFITFEAGPTHQGLESAKRLIDHAKTAGADAIKFQIIDADRLVANKKVKFSYSVLKNKDTNETEEITESLYKILRRRQLSISEWKELSDYARGNNILFFATACFDDEIEFLHSIQCDSVKIASADVNHYPLLRCAARTGMCIQLDTGKSTIGEIEKAIDIIVQEGNERIIIHHCPSGYPARLESINLNIISTLKRMFDYPIAFSDHTPGWNMDIAAVAMGVNLVEKTITEDKTTRSIEHIMSLEPEDMKKFVFTIHELGKAMGNSRRKMAMEELENRKDIRRSVYLKQSAKAGDLLSDICIEFRRPGYGIGPDLFENIKTMHLKRDLPSGHCLTLEDLGT